MRLKVKRIVQFTQINRAKSSTVLQIISIIFQDLFDRAKLLDLCDIYVAISYHTCLI